MADVPAMKPKAWRIGAAWALILTWVAAAVLPFAVPQSAGGAATVQFLALFAFAWVHGGARYPMRALLLMFLAFFVIVNVLETTSILFGFPFGYYLHHAAMGPKLFVVPIMVAPGYFAAGYLAWTLANSLLDEADTDRRTGALAALAATAAFIVTGWDAVVDPPGATALHNWTYRHGGGYFGVPLSNFGGWLLTTSLAFFAGGWLMRRFGGAQHRGQSLAWWLQPALLFAIQPLPSALARALLPARLERDAAGTAWNTAHLYEATTVVGLVTCVAFGLAAALAAWRRQTR